MYPWRWNSWVSTLSLLTKLRTLFLDTPLTLSEELQKALHKPDSYDFSPTSSNDSPASTDGHISPSQILPSFEENQTHTDGHISPSQILPSFEENQTHDHFNELGPNFSNGNSEFNVDEASALSLEIPDVIYARFDSIFFEISIC